MPQQSANQLVGTPGDDTLDRRGYTDDWTIDGRGGNDTIYGGDGHDSLIGGRGSDLIYASVNDIVIDGGAGIDTVSFADSSTGVRAILADGSLGEEPGGLLLSHVLKNVENLIGSDHDDFIAGNRAVNRINGGDGNDVLQVWGSGDFLTGGLGADTFYPLNGGNPGSTTTTITDFHYNEGDRIQMDGSPQLNWVNGTGVDAEGNVQSAWIGTCNLVSGGTLQIIVLGYDTDPNVTDWLI